jgi:hypothetical protein
MQVAYPGKNLNAGLTDCAGGGGGGRAYGFRVGVRVRDLGLLGEGLYGRRP